MTRFNYYLLLTEADGKKKSGPIEKESVRIPLP